MHVICNIIRESLLRLIYAKLALYVYIQLPSRLSLHKEMSETVKCKPLALIFGCGYAKVLLPCVNENVTESKLIQKTAK